jgi:class 3 adenylate cyclase
MTSMFCDLVESTRLSLQLDAEDFTSAVSAYRDVCARVARRWRGHISHYAGDGVLIYFGYPRAGEDDALRAVAAAWELAAAVPQLQIPQSGAKADSNGLPSLQVRIGVHTGLAVVGDFGGSDSLELEGALGASLNIASRLQALARPGQVVVSETTAALLPPTVVLQPLDRVSGRADYGPIRALLVAAMPTSVLPGRPVSASVLVGRQAIVERLLRILREQRVAAIFIQGDPGLGKSRLLGEVMRKDDPRELSWVPFTCSAYGSYSPLHPFREWLDAAGAEAAPDQGDGEVEAVTSPYDRRRRTFDKLRARLLGHESRVGLVVEDMQWADSTTIEFLAELMSTCEPTRLLLLMSSRQKPPDALAAGGHLHVEKLQRLAPGDSATLARALAAPRSLTAFELAEIVEHADGVPLYIEEFVRAIGGNDVDPDRIPITLRDSLMGVLDMLGTGRTVALCASVFGRRFSYLQLKELLGFDDAELVPALNALTQAQVLIQSGRIPDAAFEFRHTLLRDTAYHTLLKSERAHWHRRVAELAAAGRLQIQESMPELLAIHHSLGGNYRNAIGYWLAAQDQAMQRSANVEALAHIRSGLDDCRHLVDEDPAEASRLELELLRRLAPPLIAISGWSTPELEQVYGRAMSLCKLASAPDTEFELERGLYNMHLLRSDLRTADAIADRLLATAHGASDAARRETLLLVALRSKALPAFYGGSFDAARGHLEQVLRIYDPRRQAGHAFRYGTEPAMLAHCYLAWMDAAAGSVERARDHVAVAVERARAESHAFSICYAQCFAASCAQLCDDAGRATEFAEEASQLGNRHNFQYWIAWADAIRGWVTGLTAPEAGLALIDQARQSYLATGSSLVAPYFEALALDIARSSNREDASWRERELIAQATATGVWFWQGALHER